MNWAGLWTSIILVAVGAIISLGTTYLTEAGKDRRARAATEEQRKLEAANAARLEGVAVVRRLYDICNQLWQIQLTNRVASVTSPPPSPNTEEKALRRKIYDEFLLVPDATLRQAVQDSMYALGNAPVLFSLTSPRKHFPGEEAGEVLVVIRNALAAYLRGDEQNAEDITYLAGIRDDLNERFSLD